VVRAVMDDDGSSSEREGRAYGVVAGVGAMLAAAAAGPVALASPVAPAFAPKCLCLLSHWPYYAAFRSLLEQLHTYSLTGASLLHLPVEWCVCCAPGPAPRPLTPTTASL
jgi:hypothetical protein